MSPLLSCSVDICGGFVRVAVIASVEMVTVSMFLAVVGEVPLLRGWVGVCIRVFL